MDEQWQDQQCPTTRHASVNRIRRGMTRTAIHAAVATPGRASSRSRWSCSPSRDTKDVTARDRRAARRHEGRAVLPLQVQGRHRPQPRRGLLRPDRRADHLGAHSRAPRQPGGRSAPLPRDCRGRQRGIPDPAAEPGRSQQPRRRQGPREAVPGADERAHRAAHRARRERRRPAARGDGAGRGERRLDVFADQVDDRSKLSAAVLAIACDLAGTSPGPSHASLTGLA